MLTGIITNEIIFTIILTLGITFLLIEVFIPSFGVLGIFGGYLIFESILALGNIVNVGLYIMISLLISILITFMFVKLILKNKNNKLVLNTSFKNLTGVSQTEDIKKLVGKTGIVVKTLRPSGTIKVEDKEFDAISDSNFISEGEEVIVVGVKGKALYCKII